MDGALGGPADGWVMVRQKQHHPTSILHVPVQVGFSCRATMTSALASLKAGPGALASTLRPMVPEAGEGAGSSSPAATGALPKPIPAAGAGAGRAGTGAGAIRPAGRGQLLGAALQGGQGGVREFQAQQARWDIMVEWQRRC